MDVVGAFQHPTNKPTTDARYRLPHCEPSAATGKRGLGALRTALTQAEGFSAACSVPD
jgi:hypothetical protein